MEIKTTLNSAYLSIQNPGGIYRHQGKGGPGDKPWPRPRFRGKAWEARAAPPAARFLDVPLSDVLTGFQIWAPGFDETTLQSQWLYYSSLITH